MSREDVYAAAAAMIVRWDMLRILGNRSFYGVPESAGKARKWVRELLEDHVSGEVIETAELLVSEVVTNSILHSDSGLDPDGQITVGVGLGRGLVHIEVIDQGSVLNNIPAMRPVDDDSLSGRGLSWVNHLSSEWGNDHDREIGRAVWFQLALAST
ncbi:ATP-binding protein [Streptosporangium subroseum]|uniref:ATP-binding protein n=1 Tax=Streptosporangium subroseum TaxID=106412 RepID=UPI00341E1F05